MTKQASLRTLRSRAPASSDKSEALRAYTKPAQQSAAAKAICYAITPEELRRKCRRYGEAALAEARWRAIGAWLMKEPGVKLSEPLPVVLESISLCKEETRFLNGLVPPEHATRPCIMPLLSPDSQAEARRVGASVMRDWQNAGAPCLDAGVIERTHRYVRDCTKAQVAETHA